MSDRTLMHIIIWWIIFVIILFATVIYAAGPIRTITWVEPTTYTDGTPIVSPDNGVIVLPMTYDFIVDNTILVCNNVLGTSCVFEQWDTQVGVLHIVSGRTRMADGRMSDWCPPVQWVSVADNTVPPPIQVPGLPVIEQIRRP